MALTIKIGHDEISAEEIKTPQATLNINVRKTLDGNIAMFDHRDVDIIISPTRKTIIVFPKERSSDKIYDVQNRLFHFLRGKGVIVPNTVQAGDVFGSMQATYPENNDVSSLQTVIFVISKFLEQEKDKFSTYDEFDEEFEQAYTDPDEDDSTDLGEVPQASQKGSIRPGYIYSPYGISSVYRYE